MGGSQLTVENKRASNIERLLILSVVILVIIAIGCSRDDKITSHPTPIEPPTLECFLDPESVSAEPGGELSLIVNASGRNGVIEKIIYSMSGQTIRTDTLLYSPGMMELSEIIHALNEVGLNQDSSLTLEVTAIDEFGLSSTFKHSFYPFDMQPPVISIDYDVHGYAPRDIVMVHVTASDNKGLYYIAFSTAGAFAWNDTLRFEKPYPTEIDTIISIPIPIPSYLGFNFWITAEAVDINFNSSMASPDDEITIVLDGLMTEVHPIGGGNWIKRGDSLRFWVVGYSNTPLTCLGYNLQYGNNGFMFTIDLRDSINGEFDFIDSAYFAYLVPDTGYCDNYLHIKSFAYDTQGRHTSNLNYFNVEGRIRFSQATTFEVVYPNRYSLLHVDDRRNLVYVGNSDQPQINVYSQAAREFTYVIDLPAIGNWFCLSPDTNSLLVLHKEAKSVSIINIDALSPHVDTSISLPLSPYCIATLVDGTALIFAYSEDYSGSILRMNLSNYSLDSLELGMDNLQYIAASGNSEYAIISANTFPDSQLFIYQAHVGVIATRTIDWEVHRVAGNHDGSRFFAGSWSHNFMAHIFDNDLCLIDSISGRGCHQDFESAVFSRNGEDLYLKGMTSIGRAVSNGWTIEGYYGFRPELEITSFIDLATNATDNRLFVTGMKGYDFFFWDIPIDPEM